MFFSVKMVSIFYILLTLFTFKILILVFKCVAGETLLSHENEEIIISNSLKMDFVCLSSSVFCAQCCLYLEIVLC
jgi:hypothetical protein